MKPRRSAGEVGSGRVAPATVVNDETAGDTRMAGFEPPNDRDRRVILALDTNEPEILKIQSSLIKTVLSSAPGVPGQVPKKRGPTRPIQGLPSHSATEAESVPAPEKRKRSVERRK